MLARDRFNNLRRGHPHIERKLKLDQVAATVHLRNAEGICTRMANRRQPS